MSNRRTEALQQFCQTWNLGPFSRVSQLVLNSSGARKLPNTDFVDPAELRQQVHSDENSQLCQDEPTISVLLTRGLAVGGSQLQVAPEDFKLWCETTELPLELLEACSGGRIHNPHHFEYYVEDSSGDIRTISISTRWFLHSSAYLIVFARHQRQGKHRGDFLISSHGILDDASCLAILTEQGNAIRADPLHLLGVLF